MDDHLKTIKEAVIGGRHKEVADLVQGALAAGVDPETIINEAFIAGMDVVGAEFGAGRIFVPEMLVSAVTMKAGIEIVKPRLAEGEGRSRGTIIMATVKGDLHDIGKNLVSMMLEGAGFKVMDLGVDLSVEKLVDQVRALQPDILGLSALLTTTMPEMQKVIGELTRQGLRDKVKVMVGGAPVDRGFAERIGADGYGADAAEAVVVARRFADAKRQRCAGAL
jgi:5-methyltetrahydrofolate--homocysteine methyltransferase